MAPKLLIDLPPDVVQHIVVRLTLAHHIARAAPTCKVVSVAVRNAIKARRFSSEVVTLAGHTELVRCVAAAPDGRIITGSADGTVKVWRNGVCECTIHPHTRSVSAVAVLPGGARFVSVALDKTAKLWTLDGVLERAFEPDNGVRCVEALPDGAHLVVSLDIAHFGVGVENPYAVLLYHVDGTLVHTFKGHTSYVAALVVTHDGQHIISGSQDKLVNVWSVASKSLVSTCAGHTQGVLTVAAMPDGQRFLSGSMDGTVRMWLLDGTFKNTFRSHTVTALVALPDNQHALSSSYDETIKLFNVTDGTVLRTFKHHTHRVSCLALLPDGLRFVSGSGDKTARIAYHGLAPQ